MSLSSKNKIRVRKNNGGSPLPPPARDDFLGFKKKYLEAPQMTRKCIRQFVKNYPPPRLVRRKISAGVDEGLILV